MEEKYKIIRDNIITLQVQEIATGEFMIKNPLEILFSGEYLFYSKQDILRIGYICGQLNQPDQTKE